MKDNIFAIVSIVIMMALFALSVVNTYVYLFVFALLSYGASISIFYIFQKKIHDGFILGIFTIPLLFVMILKNTESDQMHREVQTYLWKYDCIETSDKDYDGYRIYKCGVSNFITTKEIEDLLISRKVAAYRAKESY
ncbi:hypothetical protein [Acinetobacter baumannii]|uniref:hypothetical protein n=1 Tax=Acinetobacter baumannii TaxID=470 RepID=UPI000FC0681B|nr:hypothetical protein [Acinetobacter baumannii]RUT37144.1 hypothetical protein EM030_18560 [Acinetobacter baumannii]